MSRPGFTRIVAGDGVLGWSALALAAWAQTAGQEFKDGIQVCVEVEVVPFVRATCRFARLRSTMSRRNSALLQVLRQRQSRGGPARQR